MLNGYNRNATIVGNEFAWVGATCVASWGYSSTCFNGNCSFKLPWREGPDARGGEQPRGTRVLNNLFREMGIFQKQASAYFHAKSGLTEIAGNGAHTARCACVDSMLTGRWAVSGVQRAACHVQLQRRPARRR